MSDMHAKPKDHLWVLVIIATCCLIETFPSWVGIGAVSGFPEIGRMPTDWTLAVTQEAYWGYALYAGIVAVAGYRSRSFALWSAGGIFALSLIGQAAYHLMAAAHLTSPPQWVVVFVAALPVIVLALAVVLIHLRHVDRAESVKAERAQREAEQRAAEEAAAADERSVLRAQLEDAQTAQEAAETRASEAERARDDAAQKADALAQKLAAANARNARSRGARKRAAAPRSERADTRATEVPDDVDARAEALSILAAEPRISGAQLGPRVGMSKRWGQEFKRDLAGAAPAGPDAGQETGSLCTSCGSP
jgi:hypothetical protein